MTSRKTAGSKPLEVDLIKGRIYSWCSCGLSFKQPFCDGEHMGTGIKPKVFKAEKSGPQHLCMCKHTNNSPFCDGTHNTKK